MKKSIFVSMISGTIGGILFSLGMCMALIPEWNSFKPGVIMGVAGTVSYTHLNIYKPSR